MPSSLEQAENIQGDIVSWRRQLNSIPELAFSEVETAGFVRARLTSFGFGVDTVAETGLVAQLGSGRILALLVAMDALSVAVPGQAQPSVMHACGHDANMACVLGAARILARRLRERSDVGLRIIMQPAGETTLPGSHQGAEKVISAGALDGIFAVLGLHVDSTIRSRKASLVQAAREEVGQSGGTNGYKSADMVTLLRQSSEEILGEANVSLVSRITYADDFGRYLERQPGAMLYLGVGLPGCVRTHHAQDFLIDESVLHLGSAILTEAALKLLEIQPRLIG
ncbi:MAG: M20/M25/M40 family metallo-hydrolase [Cyanobacteria bacterium SZAS LIN-3]|nr:M20/M25/M40 family metallo-hydrolase [Cyanobacteria bacterium SZAS LIN-3]